MNETTSLNSELLSADARGRKHIPFAVFAVILVHVILFVILLIAAGCRAKARARQNAVPETEMLAQDATTPVPTIETNALAQAATSSAPTPVVATEPPPFERQIAPSLVRKAKASANSVQRATASASQKARVYVVKAGDTVEKIARMHRTSVEAIKNENNLKDHLLRPGQQLRVGSQKQKPSNEA